MVGQLILTCCSIRNRVEYLEVYKAQTIQTTKPSHNAKFYTIKVTISVLDFLAFYSISSPKNLVSYLTHRVQRYYHG